MSVLRYFAYGSNMSIRRLSRRVPSARRLGRAKLADHQLRFHKRSHVDGTGKCDIVEVAACDVHGVVFELDAADRPGLDAAEGLNAGYAEKTVQVELASGDRLRAFTYIATITDPDLRPLDWYRQHVLAGAREAGLPADYVRAIEAVVADEDTDAERAARELSVYD